MTLTQDTGMFQREEGMMIRHTVVHRIEHTVILQETGMGTKDTMVPGERGMVIIVFRLRDDSMGTRTIHEDTKANGSIINQEDGIGMITAITAIKVIQKEDTTQLNGISATTGTTIHETTGDIDCHNPTPPELTYKPPGSLRTVGWYFL